MSPKLLQSFRYLWHSRLYTFINIIGLATGITCMLLAVLYWKDEHSFDNFHHNNPNLYRITTTLVENKGENKQTTGGTGQVQGPAFKENIPELKSFVRILGGDIFNDVVANEKNLRLRSLFVDDNFFDIFSFRLINGNPHTLLKDINAVVITESTARKFFNSTDVVGKLVNMDADPSYKRLGKPMVVTAVVQDPPKNSSLQFDALFTFSFLRLSFIDTNWFNAYLGTFVVLHPSADRQAVLRKFSNVYKLHAKEHLAENFKTYGYDPSITYGLQRITDIHLNPLMRNGGNAEAGVINGSSPVYAYMFIGIAFFILLMAGINFINISIANSLKRAKEVAIKKIAGGSRWQIILQFISESAIVCLMAYMLALVMMNVFLPLFNSVTEKQIRFSESVDIKLLGYFITLLAVIILLTGLYPAIVLSRFRPSKVLYNKQKLIGRNLFGRVLVIAQFSLAVFLLIATIVFYDQMNFIKTKDLGYNANQVTRTNVGGDRDYRIVINSLKHEFARESSIKMVSFGNDGYDEDVAVNGRNFKAVYKQSDENFLTLLEIPIKIGRGFDRDNSNHVIVNEAFVHAAEIHEPLGTGIKVNTYDSQLVKTIIGVVKDFHFGSLREPIKPMVMYAREMPEGGIWIRFDKQKQKEAMGAVERIYKKVMPGSVYDFSFLDELNARQYVQEQRWQQVISIATIISFVICCLGLFGLANLATQQRIKEIGIRKVLGASVPRIVTMLSADFLKLVIIAFVIAAPLSSLVMQNWLSNFAYRIDIGAGIYLLAAGIAIFIALSSISVQSIKTALANPVKSLSTE